jgi:membrane-associated phospholipid phosphatase
MKERLRSWFGRGVFGGSWSDAALCLALAAAVYFASGIYEGLNHGPAVLDLRTAVDSALPVVPVFVIPYVSLQIYIYASLVAFLLLRSPVYKSAALSFLMAWAVSYCFYAFLQSRVERPAIAGSDFLSAAIRRVYEGDAPYNDFPSLHTSLSAILAIHWLRMGRRAGIAAWSWTALIVASTVLIKQHYIADLGAGLLLAFGASALSRFIIEGRKGGRRDLSASRGP